MTITLQENLRAVFYAPYYCALELGAYAQEGVDVRFLTHTHPGGAVGALFDGTVDLAWGGPMRVMETYDQRPDCDLVCFGEVVTRDPFFLVGRAPNPAFTLPDLMTARLATVSEVPTPWMCLQEDMRRAGLDPAALQRIADRTMADNAAALRRGEVDVVQLFQPFVEDLVESGAGHIWYAGAARGPTSYTCFYTRRGILAARRDDFVKTVRAIHRTLLWVHASSGAQIATRIAPYFPDVPQNRLAAALDRYKALGTWGKDPRLPRAGYDRLKAGLVSGGLVKIGTPFEVAVDNTLADEILCDGAPKPLASS